MIVIDVPDRRTTNIVTRDPWGAGIHTTGSGVTKKARAKGRQPIDVALEVYLQSQRHHWGGPGYVVDHDGTVYKLADDTTRTMHIGSNGGPGRWGADYLTGRWVKMLPAEVVAQWRAAWPRRKSPQHLFPSRHPNTDYVGIETIPCGHGFGTPWRPGLRFTEEQHYTLAELAADIGERNDFPDGWWATARLVGHEDVGLLDRHDARGGWDPGALRAKPYIDFGWIRARIGELSGA